MIDTCSIIVIVPWTIGYPVAHRKLLLLEKGNHTDTHHYHSEITQDFIELLV